MTSPDNVIPGRALTGDQLATLQDVDPEALAGAANSDVTSAANGARGNLLNNLLSGFLSLNGLISAIVFGLKGVTGGLIDLTGFLVGTNNTANQAQQVAEQANTQVVAVGQSVVTVATQVNAAVGWPYWISPNPFEDVSFPVYALTPDRIPTALTSIEDGGDGDGSGGQNGNHRHDVTVSTQQPMMPMVNGRMYLIPIRATQDRLYSTLGFVTDGTAGMGFFFSAVYRVDASTGAGTKIYDAGNIKGSLITNATLPVHQRIQAPADILADAQENFYLAILATGGGTMAKLAATLGMKAVQPSGVYPPVMTGYIDALGSFPASFTNAQVQTDLGWQVWGCLGQPTTPYDPSAQFTFTENFNRGDGSGYGTNWMRQGNDQGIAGGEATALGSSDGHRSALYLKKLNTDKHYTSALLGSEPSSVTSRLYLGARADMSSWAAVEWVNSTVRIATGSGLSNGTIRSTATYQLHDQDTLEFSRYKNGSNQWVYQVFHGENLVTSWVDTGSVVAVGAAARYVGFGVNRFLFNNSGTIDAWVGRDWT